MRRVLSIQSHVVHGYCGNRAAVFPLQVLGFEVDAINSVQFSNHTQYPNVAKTNILGADELRQLVDGLEANSLHAQYDVVLSGYIGSVEFLKEVANVVRRLRGANPALLYVCDPVMGDNGCYYVPPALRDYYLSDVLPLADIATPNQFELNELLRDTDHLVESEADVRSALESLQSAMSLKSVVLTSTSFGYPSTVIGFALCQNVLHRFSTARFDIDFVGTGDLFAALFTAWYFITDSNVELTLRNVLNTLRCVLEATSERFKAASSTGGGCDPSAKELCLIPCLNSIISPKTQPAIEIARVDR